MFSKLVATSAAAALLAALPASTAAAADPTKGPWQRINDSVVLPAGSACQHSVIESFRGAFREVTYSNGAILQEYKNWTYAKFRKQGTKKSYRVPAGGDLIGRISQDRKTVAVSAWGANYLGGQRGVYGIPWTRGPVTYRIINFGTSDETVVDLDLSRVKRFKQICYEVGSRPVSGRNVLLPG